MRLQSSWTSAGGPVVRRLSAGLLLSRTGDQLTTIALLWFVLDLTGSGVAVGLVLLCAGLPPVVTGPLLGRLLDRWPLRRVLIADNLLRAALIGAIPLLHWLDRLNMPLIYGLSLAAGALLPATDVGVRVVLPQLVDEPELEPANAMLSIGDQVSALVGPAAGGVLVGLVGAPPVLLLDAASFLAMATLVRSLPDTPRPPRPRRHRPTARLAGCCSGTPPSAPSWPSPWSTSWPTGRSSRPCRCTAATSSTPAPAATACSGRPLAPAHSSAWPPSRSSAGCDPASPWPATPCCGERPCCPWSPSPAPSRRSSSLPSAGWSGRPHHPGGVPAATDGPGLHARLGVRGPPRRDRRGRTTGRRRRRAPPSPHHPKPGHRPLRCHLHPRRHGRAVLPGPPPPPDPGLSRSTRAVRGRREASDAALRRCDLDRLEVHTKRGWPGSSSRASARPGHPARGPHPGSPVSGCCIRSIWCP